MMETEKSAADEDEDVQVEVNVNHNHVKEANQVEDEDKDEAQKTNDEEDDEPEQERLLTPPLARRKRRTRRKSSSSYEEGEEALSKHEEVARLLSIEEDGWDTIELFRELATSKGGLIDDDLRRIVWPRLAHIDLIEAQVLATQAECEKHAEYNQVVLDVARSLKRFPPGIAEEARPELQDQLTRLIVRVLLKHPDLHYYQGFHDVAITFLLVVGEEMAYHIVQRLAHSHLKEFMAPTMDRTTHLLNYMYPVFERECPELHDFMEASEVGTIFALPWLITWFGHVLPDYDDVVRLYDFFLAKPPLMPVYLAAALVLHRKKDVLGLSECDLAAVHGLLSRIPNELPFEKLLVETQRLYDEYPPEALQSDVEDRMQRLERQMRRPGTIDSRQALAASLGFPVVAGVALLAAPVVIGIAAYKWLNAPAPPAPP